MRQLKITKSITDRSSAMLDKYLSDISKEPMITAEEEIDLARKIKKGDEEALEKLVKANLRFVVSCAKQYQSRGLSLTDLINEGNLGLIKAARRFDETRGFKFISYAVWWIRQSIMQAIAENSRMVRLPLNQHGSLNKINKAFSALEQELEREPSNEELAEVLEMDVEKIDSTMQISGRHISMDAPIGDDETGSLKDIMPNKDTPTTDNSLMAESLSHELNRSLQTLDEREREVVKMFYGIGQPTSSTLEEIGEKYNITRERARQLRDKGLHQLRKKTSSNLLKQYLG
ncbi:MAG: RNA polymerase sigma factor RpoD/SigA [Bacteroidia bacterium]|nr:RNA polymerase sigma factor RpoD/SigA [Bacteroidia bacterium]